MDFCPTESENSASGSHSDGGSDGEKAGTEVHSCSFDGCVKSFDTSRKLKRHIRNSHLLERTYSCPVPGCGKSYRRATHLQRHTLSHGATDEERKPFVCERPGCEARFPSRQHLKRHELSHDVEKPYTCTQEGCDEAFAKAAQLRRHVAEHNGTLPFVCTHPGCTKSFKTTQKLKAHEHTHSDDNVYKCGYRDCDQHFPKWSLLQQHIKSEHKRQLGAICPICNKSFKWADNLKKHVTNTHSEARDEFPCTWDGCYKMLSSVRALRLHIRVVHEEIKDFKCRDCGEAFGYKLSLLNHIKRGHKKETDSGHSEGELRAPTSKKVTQKRKRAQVPGSAAPTPRPEISVPAETDPKPQPKRMRRKPPSENERIQDSARSHGGFGPRPVISLAQMITGYNYDADARRRIPCIYANDSDSPCGFRFVRDYDLMRHLLAYHGHRKEDGLVGEGDGTQPAGTVVTREFIATDMASGGNGESAVVASAVTPQGIAAQ
ncbi:hypothetical protein BJ742DRAFT_119091 [Cladochytrium replicatum]|nr:hypothetical protein BJ742DRAFT_119091 [Cladochytrium replicatum]